MRALRAVLPADAQPEVMHMNEGHSAFLSLELARERLVTGAAKTFDDALLQGAQQLAFTTHTPVAAGHDAFRIAAIAPALLLFTPCVDGLSHNEHEDIEFERVLRGANVLAASVLEVAGL